MKRRLLLLLMMTLLACCTASAESSTFDLTFTDRELSGAWDARSAITIMGLGTKCTISGKGASFADNRLTIATEGTYLLQGSFTDIQIVVSAGDKAKVQIVLADTEITAENGPALYVESADKLPMFTGVVYEP